MIEALLSPVAAAVKSMTHTGEGDVSAIELTCDADTGHWSLAMKIASTDAPAVIRVLDLTDVDQSGLNGVMPGYSGGVMVEITPHHPWHNIGSSNLRVALGLSMMSWIVQRCENVPARLSWTASDLWCLDTIGVSTGSNNDVERVLSALDGVMEKRKSETGVWIIRLLRPQIAITLSCQQQQPREETQ